MTTSPPPLRTAERVDLQELLALAGVTEDCVLRTPSPVGILALHGGSQDRGTDLIARIVAERANASYYAIVQPPDVRVHLTSHRHRPEQSAVLSAFLAHVQIALSIHGFGRDSLSMHADPTHGLIIEPYGPPLRGAQTGPLRGIIVGGANAELETEARALLDNVAGCQVAAAHRVRLGFHPDNPVNLPPQNGVQIELPPCVRGIGLFGEQPSPDPDDIPVDLLQALVDLAAAAERVALGSAVQSS